jgi:hypothetical protein
MGDTPKEPPARRPQTMEEFRAQQEQQRAKDRAELAKPKPPERPPEQALMLRRDWGLRR